ncbi:MAG: hypothetical protein Q7S44_03585 [bacterium]|nr:hypothetical protein [bacterium]
MIDFEFQLKQIQVDPSEHLQGDVIKMARPGIPDEKPIRREHPYIPYPIKIPTHVPEPTHPTSPERRKPEIVPREPVPIRR